MPFREKVKRRIDLDVLSQLAAVADANIDQPNKGVSGQLLRPGQGIVEYIAHDHLHEHQQGHKGHEEYTNIELYIVIQPFQDLFQDDFLLCSLL